MAANDINLLELLNLLLNIVLEYKAKANRHEIDGEKYYIETAKLIELENMLKDLIAGEKAVGDLSCLLGPQYY
jgi:hypothetical protein